MKKHVICLLMATIAMTLSACSPEDGHEPPNPETEIPDTPDDEGADQPGSPDMPDNPENPDEPNDTPEDPVSGRRILVAYFSWGGTTQRMAQEIVRLTGAEQFRIDPVTPYPTEYTPCTEVARTEKETNARPAIKNRIENWEEYDTVFIGCPVWWWTTPMIICTFTESYDFNGKTVVPFCTYAATYRDETLARIVELTPDAVHLTGEGLTSGRIDTATVAAWLRKIGMIE